MASADDVFAAVQAALGTTTVRLSIPGDLATPQNGVYPNLKLRIEGDNKLSMGRSSVGFTTTVVIRIIGEVSEPVAIDDDVAVSQVIAKLLVLKRIVERAVINSYPLFNIVQQLTSVTTQFSYVAADTRLAGVQSDYAFEIFETADDFAPLEVDDLALIAALDPHHPGVGLTVATL